jgi:hypothetical protein
MLRYRWEDNNKRVLREKGFVVMSEFNWLTTGAKGGIYEHGNESSGSEKSRGFFVK